jgi:phosphatidylglycerophosphatase A
MDRTHWIRCPSYLGFSLRSNGLFRHQLFGEILVSFYRAGLLNIERMNRVILFLATLGPVGTKLPAPGTMGSLAGLFIYVFMTLFLGWSALLVALSFLPLFLLGIPLCSRAEILLDRSDPGEVIWDEFTVIPIVFLPLFDLWEIPPTKETLFWILFGFALFRFFDVTKPWIIHHAQRLPRGWGVMIDDLLAAIAAGLVLWVSRTFSLSFLP